MAARTPQTTRNVAFCGHGTCGKTTLIEGLLAKAKAISRPGSVADKSTVCDFDDLEKEKGYSIDLATAHLDHGGATVNIIDTPGYRDYVGQVYSAVRAIECMIVVVDSDDGVRPNTRKVWEIADQAGVPRIVVINRCDREHAKDDEVVAELREQLSPACHPIQKPDAIGPSFSSVSSLVGGEGGEDLQDAIAEADDDLMERYLGGEDVSAEEWQSGLVAAVKSCSVFPVLYAAGEKDIGTAELLDAIVELVPNASESLGRTCSKPADGDAEPEQVPVATDVDSPLCGFVFRVASDPYVGKLSYVRIFSGSLAANGTFYNPNSRKMEKAGKFVRLQGKEQEAVESAVAGDVIALVKVEGLKAFDTITAGEPLALAAPKLPMPMYRRAVGPKSKADEKKFAEAIAKCIDEDVMFAGDRDKRTHELVVSGVSQLHLSVLWDRLKGRYGVEVTTTEPKTPYLETITVNASGSYRHKKQSGGAGEFAEVHLRLEPLERGSGHEFVNSVFGGAIAATYVQSAEKGIRAALESGVIAGYPVVDVKVDIYDGKEHPVDSKDIAFQKAGREAFKVAFQECKPVLLEPIVNLEVTFPVENMGDIQGDLNRRRGRVVGMDAVGSFQTLKAQAPLAEISDYATTLGSMTAGQGTFDIELSHYEVVPSNLQQKICEQAKAELEKDQVA